MATNNYNKQITMGRMQLNRLLDFAYEYGKSDGGETSFKEERDEKIESILKRMRDLK